MPRHKQFGRKRLAVKQSTTTYTVIRKKKKKKDKQRVLHRVSQRFRSCPAVANQISCHRKSRRRFLHVHKNVSVDEERGRDTIVDGSNVPVQPVQPVPPTCANKAVDIEIGNNKIGNNNASHDETKIGNNNDGGVAQTFDDSKNQDDGVLDDRNQVVISILWHALKTVHLTYDAMNDARLLARNMSEDELSKFHKMRLDILLLNLEEKCCYIVAQKKNVFHNLDTRLMEKVQQMKQLIFDNRASQWVLKVTKWNVGYTPSQKLHFRVFTSSTAMINGCHLIADLIAEFNVHVAIAMELLNLKYGMHCDAMLVCKLEDQAGGDQKGKNKLICPHTLQTLAYSNSSVLLLTNDDDEFEFSLDCNRFPGGQKTAKVKFVIEKKQAVWFQHSNFWYAPKRQSRRRFYYYALLFQLLK